MAQFLRKRSIGDECYNFRIRHNMTQDDFAKLTGLCRSTVNYIECERREPARYTAARLRLIMREYDAKSEQEQKQ